MLKAPTKVRKSLTQWRKELQLRYEKEEISASKIRGDVAAVRGFFEAAVDAGMVAENAAEGLKSVARPKSVPRPMPMADVQQLFKTIPEFDLCAPNPSVLRDRAMMELYRNGLRNNEVCRVNTDWLEFVPGERSLVLTVLGKGNKVGKVVLNPGSADTLALHTLVQFLPEDWQGWLAEFADRDQPFLWAVDRMLRRKLLDQSHPVFLYKGSRMTRRESNRMFVRYRKAAGISDEYGPHSLRHTCATELFEAGVDIRTVQEILRHEHISSTQIYTKVRIGPKAQAMRLLPALTQ